MTEPFSQYTVLYEATIEDAALSGKVIMGKLIAALRKSIQERLGSARDYREREAYECSLKALHAHESELLLQYPNILLASFSDPLPSSKTHALNMAEVQFDQLELMDETQVQESVNMARAQQMAVLAAESSLAELNTLICATLGLVVVRPERNPLRPDVYLQALKLVVQRMPVPATMRLDWLTMMGQVMGPELRELYERLVARLRAQGVVAAGYAVTATAANTGPGKTVTPETRGPASASSRPDAKMATEPRLHRVTDPALLTLDRLRKLLSGELDGRPMPGQITDFADQFSREFESDFERLPHRHTPSGGFVATVPAAFEALSEMKQVDRVVQRLVQRQSASQGEALVSSVQLACDVIRRQATGAAQALSLEVVSLMVDNIASDPRLLAPVQELVRRMEPALMRLALVDSRIFTSREHAARCLVQEITHRSLAFTSAQARGFTSFHQEVCDAVAPLIDMDIPGPEPFAMVLLQLRASWDMATTAQEASRRRAVQALQMAEQRNLLAEKIAREIDSHPDAAQVPGVVTDFLCGPWSQVVANARLQSGAGSGAADKYQALISAMLWSAHPELARNNVAKLTRLVPLLISTMREGLESIQYPATKASVFLEALMGLHQQAFRSATKPLSKPETITASVHVQKWCPVEDGNPWVAPKEARESNFMELPDAHEPQISGDVTAEAQPPLQPVVFPSAAVSASLTLPVGAWVDLMAKGEWMRTQLTWASPHGSLFLFTSVDGIVQSMTRRTFDKLLAAGQLNPISGQPLVEGALDAVAQQAMRNSVNSKL